MKGLKTLLIGIFLYFIGCAIVVFYSFNFIAFIILVPAIYFIIKGCINTTN